MIFIIIICVFVYQRMNSNNIEFFNRWSTINCILSIWWYRRYCHRHQSIWFTSWIFLFYFFFRFFWLYSMIRTFQLIFLYMSSKLTKQNWTFFFFFSFFLNFFNNTNIFSFISLKCQTRNSSILFINKRVDRRKRELKIWLKQ